MAPEILLRNYDSIGIFFVDNFKKYFLNGKAGKSIRLSDSTE